jgi:hypothetical protein
MELSARCLVCWVVMRSRLYGNKIDYIYAGFDCEDQSIAEEVIARRIDLGDLQVFCESQSSPVKSRDFFNVVPASVPLTTQFH